ncbi:MAG: flagellar export protein FliJ [Bilophila sp.]
MPFRFPLQQVLAFREQLKDQAQVELARVLAELQREQAYLALLQTQLREQEEALYVAPLDDSGQRWLLDNFIKGLHADIHGTLARIQTANSRVEDARKALALRAKEHKVLDKLKARQAERHASNERLQEQRTYDETAALRFKAPTF